ELLLLLFPLWAVCAWRALRSPKSFAFAAAVLAASSALWIGFLLAQFPSIAVMTEVFRKYLADQSRDLSPVFGATVFGWRRMLFRTLVWNGTAVIAWVVLAPLARIELRKAAWWFIALWIVPSLIFHAAVHLDDPDQALATIPALCLAGGAVLVSFVQRNRD